MSREMRRQKRILRATIKVIFLFQHGKRLHTTIKNLLRPIFATLENIFPFRQTMIDSLFLTREVIEDTSPRGRYHIVLPPH